MESRKLENVITRIAPSPTGALHIGTARTALFNYLFAKQNKGKFILRIEDTDAERGDAKYEQDILESLEWLGIKWDGEVYKQSQRIPIYKKYLEKLLKEKKVYYCFCSKEELETTRKHQMSAGQAPHYNGKCAVLSEQEVQERLKKGDKSVIRFRISKNKIVFQDLVRGNVEFDSSLFGDIVIAKDLETPLYNFAVAVDDFEMKINYIIRGEDHISNTPKQILIQEALGFSAITYAHLPLILGPDRAKLSKRHNAVSITQYKEEGYLPEAMINFMAFLGWNPGTEKEIFSMESLIKEFSLKKIQKAGAVFNIKRLDWLNGFYIRQKSLDELTNLCIPYLVDKEMIEPIFESQEAVPNLACYFGRTIALKYIVKETKEKIDFDGIKRMIALYQERLKKLSEIPEFIDFFFKQKLAYDKDLLKWKDMSNELLKKALDKLEEKLSGVKPDQFDKENLEKVFLREAEKFDESGNRGYLLWPFRVAITGKKMSASPFEVAEILGKEKTLERIKTAKQNG